MAREASADARQAARGLRDMYDALMAEGFTPDQAVALMAEIVRRAAP